MSNVECLEQGLLRDYSLYRPRTMYPPQLIAEYPRTAVAFMQMMRRDTSSRAQEDRSAIKAELLKQPPDRSIVEALFAIVWAEAKQSRADFAVRTGDAFSYLGVCDEVRALIGGVWAAGFRQWNPAEQLEFLRLLLTSQELHRDLVLEFLPGAAPDLGLTPRDFWSWVVDSRQGRPAYPHRMPAILQSYARAKPQDALRMAELFLPQVSDAANARLIALLVHWVRDAGPDGEVRSSLANFEMTLASVPAEYRSVLLESWAFSAAAPALDEATAADLKQRLVRGVAEAKTWCFLLQQVVMSSPAKQPWAMAELRVLAATVLSAEQKHLVVTAVLHGWLNAEQSSLVPRVEWETLIRTLAPLEAEDAAVWDHFGYFLVDAFERDAAAAVLLVALIAETSGRGWSKVMGEKRNTFDWWCQTLRDGGHAQPVVTTLCFSNVRCARQVGLHIVQRCGTAAFGTTLIPQATADQIERLLLEATVKSAEYDFIARLHLAFAERIDQLGATLGEWFYDEALTQALNTNKYRQAILDGAATNSKLRGVVEEAIRRIDVSVKASESPALRMRIPGHARAEALSMRHFGRMVAKGMAKYSVFSQLFPTVPLLYGRSWRMADASGAVGAATTLNKIETSMEMPRLEFMTPEAMRHRRLVAVKRIIELDQGVDQEP